MKKKIKLIAFDLDGSLLDDRGEISDYTINVLKKVVDNGIKIVPISGRPMQSILPVVSKVKGIEYIVSSNGATIIEAISGNIIKKQALDKKVALDIYDLGVSLGGTPAVFINEHIFRDDYKDFLETNRYMEFDMFHKDISTKINNLGMREYLLNTEYTIEKIGMHFHTLDEKSRALEKYKSYRNISLSFSFKLNIEVNAARVNKGYGLKEVSRIYNIPLEETMCFGDGVNDIPMLEKAGFAVVMKNALEELERYGDYITVSNNDDGVAKAIEMIAL